MTMKVGFGKQTTDDIRALLAMASTDTQTTLLAAEANML